MFCIFLKLSNCVDRGFKTKQWADFINDSLNICVADVFHQKSYKTNIASHKLVPGPRTKLQLLLLGFSMSKSLIK